MSWLASDMNPRAGVSWPDLPDTVNAFHLGPEWVFRDWMFWV